MERERDEARTDNAADPKIAGVPTGQEEAEYPDFVAARQAPTPEEIARRKVAVDRMRADKARTPVQELSTVEMVRQAREELEQ